MIIFEKFMTYVAVLIVFFLHFLLKKITIFFYFKNNFHNIKIKNTGDCQKKKNLQKVFYFSFLKLKYENDFCCVLVCIDYF
jgi:hypothetical protein